MAWIMKQKNPYDFKLKDPNFKIQMGSRSRSTPPPKQRCQFVAGNRLSQYPFESNFVIPLTILSPPTTPAKPKSTVRPKREKKVPGHLRAGPGIVRLDWSIVLESPLKNSPWQFWAPLPRKKYGSESGDPVKFYLLCSVLNLKVLKSIHLDYLKLHKSFCLTT